MYVTAFKITQLKQNLSGVKTPGRNFISYHDCHKEVDFCKEKKTGIVNQTES
jgi:hypothetical protein